jgi:formate hydrogenlyase subunit 4
MTALNVLWQAILLLFGSTLVALVYKGIDRKFAAWMQGRIGPPIRQPFLDLGKLLVKETVVPRTAVGWVFGGMPFLALLCSAAVLFYLPIGPFAPVLSGHGDLVLVLYLLAMPALALALGGFASGSPYAALGAQREMVMMMSYEFPLAITIVGVVWRLSTLGYAPAFSLATVASRPLWTQVGPFGVLGLALLLGSLLVVTPAELGKIPFDIPEAETEIAGGLLVEYSGTNLALFYLADALKTVAMGSLLVALFVPYGIAGPLGIGGVGGQVLDLAFFLVKLFFVIFAAVTTVRVAFARLKVDQIARMFWLPVTTVALVGLLLLVLDKVVG